MSAAKQMGSELEAMMYEAVPKAFPQLSAVHVIKEGEHTLVYFDVTIPSVEGAEKATHCEPWGWIQHCSISFAVPDADDEATIRLKAAAALKQFSPVSLYEKSAILSGNLDAMGGLSK